MYEDMLRNIRTLPGPDFWANIGGYQRAGRNCARRSRAGVLAGKSGSFCFARRIPATDTTPNAYYVNYKNWSQTSLDTTLGALRAAGLQGQQLQSEQSILNSLRGMAQSSDGRMQALQVMGQINEQQVQQLMKMRELMMADMSSKQAYQAAMIQNEAAAQAASERFFTFQRDMPDGLTFKGGWK